MFIHSNFNWQGDLEINAYTFDLKELRAVEKVLAMLEMRRNYKTLPSDKAGRRGRRYTISKTIVPRLEAILEGAFDPIGQFFSYSGSGDTYACREIQLRGRGVGCEEIAAPDMEIAQFKCALVARKNNWFGGVPDLGTCS